MNLDLDALERLSTVSAGKYWDIWEDGSSHERGDGSPYVLLTRVQLAALIAELRASRKVVAAAQEWVQAEEAPTTQPLGPGDYAYQRAGAYIAVKKALASYRGGS